MSKPQDLYTLVDGQTSKLDDLDIDSDDLSIQRLIKIFEARHYKSDTSDRKWLAIWTAIVVSTWVSAVMFILLTNEKYHYCLNTTVLVTLLGTTTLNVLGLSFIVLRGHFQSTSK